MSLTINPTYNQFPNIDWKSFRTLDDNEWETRSPDLNLFEWAQKTTSCFEKIMALIFWPYNRIKSWANHFALRQLYPAQLEPKDRLDMLRRGILMNRNQNGCVVRHLRFKRNEENYSALLIGRKVNLSNGQWVLHVNGQKASIEQECLNQPNYLDAYLQEDFNVLLVNGPGVGRSAAMNTLEQLGDAQELGLLFLESAIKAQKIVLTGVSLGAGALSLVIQRHIFLNRDYLVLRLISFDRLSHLVQKTAGKLGQWLLSWLGYEIDSISASRKLQQQRIPEVIYQNFADPCMQGAELAKTLQREGIVQDKTFRVNPVSTHWYSFHQEVVKEIRNWNHLKNIQIKSA